MASPLVQKNSQDSTPANAERSIVFHLIPVTLAGEEIQMPIELQGTNGGIMGWIFLVFFHECGRRVGGVPRSS